MPLKRVPCKLHINERQFRVQAKGISHALCISDREFGGLFFDEDVFINPFMASGASGTLINDFAGDNFDHSGLGFIGGAFIGAVNTNGRPIQYHPVPPGTPRGARDGRERDQTLQPQCDVQPARQFCVDALKLSRSGSHLPDAWGQPLLRMTFDFPQNDLKMRPTSRPRVSRSAKPWARSRLPARRARPLHDDGVSDDAQHGRYCDGQRSSHERRQSLSAILGRPERVRHRSIGLSAECALESERYIGCVDVLGNRRP